jgi:ABC-2 type transport system ATP-binding protein
MNPLVAENFCKTYPTFSLKEVSFSLEQGKITGFIGRNGAGKTTTLKCLFNIVHPDRGQATFFGKTFREHELEIKQQVGYVCGGIDYYTQKKLQRITEVTKRFYTAWDDTAYKRYLSLFNLDEGKTPAQLSAGMKVKYALTLALSHNAELLILDEPTSGLDPVSRDELLQIFLELCDQGKTIFFSTHITSDLDNCADNIIYISDGAIKADTCMKSFVEGYRVVELPQNGVPLELESSLIGRKRTKTGYSALVKAGTERRFGLPAKEVDLEEIMVHLEKERETCAIC